MKASKLIRISEYYSKLKFKSNFYILEVIVLWKMIAAMQNY